MAWPFAHDWSSSYRVTYSFKTEVLTSRDGHEQRRSLRYEPRRALATRVTVDSRSARDFDRFVWNQKAGTFTFDEPRGGNTVTVRLGETVAVDHVTSGVSTADVALAVEPGTETFAEPVTDASFSYGLRLVFPFRANWFSGVGDSILLPRDVTDFDYGRIRVAQPVAFATRTTQIQTIVEDDRLSDFFRNARGRAGDFLIVSALDDLETVSLVGTALTVTGDARPLDGVDWGIRLELTTGGRYFRAVTAGAVIANGTVLTLDQGVPDIVNANTVRRCSWVRLGRFASDDLLIDWVTETVGQAQVALQTLPPAPVEDPLAFDEAAQTLVDYYGWPDWIDPLDFIVNVQMPRISGAVVLEEWYWDGLNYVVNIQMPRL